MDDAGRAPLGEPPADAEAWTDEQWIAWLEATDAEEDEAGAPRLRSGARRPASMLGVAMLGLRDLIYGRVEEAAIVVDCGGDPPRGDTPEVHLDPDHPERSTVVVRRSPPA